MDVVRWLAVLPAALLSVLVLVPLNFAAHHVAPDLGDGFMQAWRWGIGPMLMAFVFVFGGTWAAPKGKFRVALTLYVLAIGIITTSTLFRLALPEANDSAWPLMSVVATILGGVVSVFLVRFRIARGWLVSLGKFEAKLWSKRRGHKEMIRG